MLGTLLANNLQFPAMNNEDLFSCKLFYFFCEHLKTRSRDFLEDFKEFFFYDANSFISILMQNCLKHFCICSRSPL